MRIKGVSRGRTLLGPGELVSAAARETAPEQFLTELRPSASAVTLHLLPQVLTKCSGQETFRIFPRLPSQVSASTEWQPGWIISIVLSGYKQPLCFSHDPAILKPDFLFLGSHRGSLPTTKASRKSSAGLTFYCFTLHHLPLHTLHQEEGTYPLKVNILSAAYTPIYVQGGGASISVHIQDPFRG